MNHVRLSVNSNSALFLLFLMLAFAVYGGILGHEFIFNWDDKAYVTGNEAVRGFTLAHLKSAFSSFYVGNYAPLHIISYMLDYTFWGMDPHGYLLANVLIHAINAFLAFRLFLLLDGRLLVALTAAVLFLVHPVQVESVAWVSERKTLLAMLFFLLALHAYSLYCSEVQRKRRRWYLLSLLSFCAALLSKAVVVIFPLLIISFDWYCGGLERIRKGFADKIPFIILSAGLTAVTLFSQRSGKMLVSYVDGNPLNNAMTMMPVFARYLGMLFWPTRLAPIYSPPVKTSVDLEVLLSLLLVGAVLILSYYLFSRRRLAGFAIALFLLGLLPIAHIFPLPTLMQDRYLYFPLLGFSLLIATITADTAETFAGKRRLNWGIACLLILALPLAITAQRQTRVWRNALTLWTHTAQSVPQSNQALLMLAITRHDQQDLAGAEEAYLRVLSISPRDLKGLNGLGVLYGERGMLDKSLRYLRQAVEVAPGDTDVLVNFGYAAFLKGDLEECRDSFQRAIGIKPPLLAMLMPTLLEIASRQNDQVEVVRLKALARETGGAL